MKQKIFTLLLAVAASIGTMFARDYERVLIGDLYYNLNATYQPGEIEWKFVPAKGVLTISGTGAMPNYTSDNRPEWEKFKDYILKVVIEDGVTSVGAYAFYGYNYLSEVVFPSTLTFIGKLAFYNSGLTSPVYNAHVFAFMPTSYSGAYTIPDGIESIAGSAFSGCTGLTSVTIPNSVTSIGEKAFYGCTSLTSPVYNTHVFAFMPTSYSGAYTIPDGIESIAGSAFSGCTGLTSVTIPNSVTSIGEKAFYGCTSLTSPVYNTHVFAFMPTSYSGAYTIPDGIESIAGSAFSGCTGLTSVTIPNSVTSIGNDAFYGCTSLTSPVYNTHVFAYMPTSYSGAYTIPDGIESIAGDAFSNCSGLTSVTIPNSVTSIGNDAFYGCTSLTSPVYNTHVFAYMPTSYSGAYTIPDGIESIAGDAFSNCSGLTSVTIPNSVTSIGGYAFAHCTGLASVTMEAETPPTLGSFALDYTNDCPIYVPCGTLDAYKSAWSGYADRIKYEVAYTIIGNVNDAKAGSVDYPTSSCGDVVITAVPNNGYHFTQWSDGLKDNPRTIELTQDTTFTAEFAPDRVGTCGKDLALVWSYDPTNKVLTIGNAGEFTENMQFGLEAPGEMEELVIGNSVTAIGASAFAGIKTLKKITIGESVKTIGEQAFYNCMNLETIFNYRPTPTNTYSNAFDGVDKFECTLYVLPSSIDMYKAAAVWRDFYYTYAIGAEEATVTTNDVTVEPQDNAATVTWPTNDNAATYTIQITKDGEVFCTLIFNANGQLTGIAFAPSRDGQAHAPQAIMTANGMQFTVTGLDSGTHYALTLQAKDSQETVLASYSSEFTTTGQNAPKGLDEISSSLQGGDRGRLIYHDGQIFILRGEKVYTLTGQEIK